jgi:hypothetical protein
MQESRRPSDNLWREDASACARCRNSVSRLIPSRSTVFANAIRPLRTNKRGRPAPLPTVARASDPLAGRRVRAPRGSVLQQRPKRRPMNAVLCQSSVVRIACFKTLRAYGKLTRWASPQSLPILNKAERLETGNVPLLHSEWFRLCAGLCARRRSGDCKFRRLLAVCSGRTTGMP